MAAAIDCCHLPFWNLKIKVVRTAVKEGLAKFKITRYFTSRTLIDGWGCIWEVLQDGVIGEIKRPILAD